MPLSRRRMTQDAVELNITAFMNLMVILVPFLLITAVFSKLTVIDLNLPPEGTAAGEPDQSQLNLQLIVEMDNLEINETKLGSLGQFAIDANAIDWQPVVDRMVEIKRRLPEADSITLLFAKEVPYRTMITAMDKVRSVDLANVTSVETYELFPNISIGDLQTPQAAPDA